MALQTVLYIFGYMALVGHELPGKYLREERKRMAENCSF